MDRQIQGIALLLFGILLSIVGAICLWLGYELSWAGLFVFLPGGLIAGVIGLRFCFRRKQDPAP